MQQQQSTHNIPVTWRGKKFVLEMNSGATLQELGHELQKLTDVKADTMRLIVPQASNKSSKLLYPFSEEHASLSLREESFLEGKSIRMMGAPQDEVDEVLQNAKANLRIAGFDEEERRLRHRMLNGPHSLSRLPEGPYIFCDFRTLHIPGIELNPPASEALKRMHMLAADPGIVAIMNKHRWRVGIMTEMAPVGYVGVSPKCILGFNKNHGEEISLRLRTDDLKGFRKYESVKKTLLHELAHMVFSEHNANFYALDKQLNEEATTLDWTRSNGHTLSGVRHSERDEEGYFVDNHSNFSQKLGGTIPDQLASARATSVAAAFSRLANASKVHQEPEHDDFELGVHSKDVLENGKLNIENSNKCDDNEPDPDDCPGSRNKFEPDPDDTDGDDAMEYEPYPKPCDSIIIPESGNDDARIETLKEPDPDALEDSPKYRVVVDSDCTEVGDSVNGHIRQSMIFNEPDPDGSKSELQNMGYGNIPRPDDILVVPTFESDSQLDGTDAKPDPDDSLVNKVMHSEPDPDDNMGHQQRKSISGTGEPDPDDQELQRIQDPVTIICSRLQKAIERLQSEVNPSQVASVLETLFKIIRNLIEHPNDMKFKRIRKTNPIIQRNVANYKAAMEILFLIGFNEDVVLDEIGKAETYLVLKRNDLGLLWLAKSSLETCIAY